MAEEREVPKLYKAQARVSLEFTLDLGELNDDVGPQALFDLARKAAWKKSNELVGEGEARMVQTLWVSLEPRPWSAVREEIPE